MIEVLLDEGLPAGTVTILRSQGHEASHVSHVGLSRASDGDILEYARCNGQVLFTFDADFHQLLAESGSVRPSVVRIHGDRLKADAVAKLVLDLIPILEQILGDKDGREHGIVASVRRGRLRIHDLPLLGGDSSK